MTDEDLKAEFVRRVNRLLDQDGERTYSGSVNIPVDIDEVLLGNLMLCRIEETDESNSLLGAQVRVGTRVSAYTLNPRALVYTEQAGDLGRGITFGIANVRGVPRDAEVVVFEHDVAKHWIPVLRARMVLEDLADV